jgi:hypothetical protein
MRPSKHETMIEVEFRFHVGTDPIGGDDIEVAYPKINVIFTYLPGSPGVRYLRNGDPGYPPDPAELEFVSAALLDGDGCNPKPEHVAKLAQEYLDSDDGYRYLCEVGEDQLMAAAEAAMYPDI